MKDGVHGQNVRNIFLLYANQYLRPLVIYQPVIYQPVSTGIYNHTATNARYFKIGIAIKRECMGNLKSGIMLDLFSEFLIKICLRGLPSW